MKGSLFSIEPIATQPGVYIYVDETVWGPGRLPVSKTRNSLEALNNTTAVNLYCRNPIPVFVNQSWDAALPIKYSGK